MCKFNRVKDWAGRNIAHSKVSTASFACDLTYGPELDENRMPVAGKSDHIRASVLTYSDVQKFLKYLRSTLGYELDYFVTGEMGSLKGRAHWHIILHFKGRVPTHEVGLNFSDRHKNERGQVFDHEVCKAWPHGFMYWKKAAYDDVFYNCKYILKDEDDDKSQRKPGMSKKPPLGAEYFERVAEQAVKQGISPQTLEYRFPEIKVKKTKKPVLFFLQGRSAELYLDHFIKTWAEQRGDQPRPKSDLVDLYEQYGQVVHNENALLVRREFPKGESRQRIPTGPEIRAGAAQAKADKAEWQQQEEQFQRSEWWFRWVGAAKNEQERQKREELWQCYHAEQDHQRQQYLTDQARKGLVWVDGEWVKDPDFEPLCVDTGGAGPGAPVERERPDYGDGKTGRWNKYYGSQAGADASGS